MLQFRGSLGPISRLGRGHTGLLFRTQVALLLAYCGTRYQGLQKNPGAVTVEETLGAAIHRAGGITADNVGTLQKVSWSRAGRTDKGVSALGQVVALHLRSKLAAESLLNLRTMSCFKSKKTNYNF